MQKIKLALAAVMGFIASLGETVHNEFLMPFVSGMGMVMYANPYSQFTYDNSLLLEASATHSTAQTDVGATILDLGAGLVDGYLVIDVSAIDVASTDEYYTLSLEGSNVAAMTSGSVELALIRMGNNIAPNDADTGTGRFVVPFRNEQNGTLYRYVRMSTKVEGTTPSITFSAFIAKDE